MLTMLGVDFRSAPLADRERLAYGPDAAAGLLRSAAKLEGFEEGAIISTCNRTEFYLVGQHDVADAFLGLLCRETQPPDGCVFTRRAGADAARHLIRVGCGLESAILGDNFILGQVKRAMAIASGAGTLGPVLSRLFRGAFEASREANSTTDIARGEAGLGAAVAALVETRRGREATTLLVGAGATAADIARQLAKRGVHNVTVVNRTRDRADALARHNGFAAVDWTELGTAIRSAAVVISSVGSATPVIGAQAIAASQPGLLVIDIGVPRNVEDPVGREYLTIDEIAHRQGAAVERRRAAVPHVEGIVAAHLAAWNRWMLARPIESLLKDMFADEARARDALARELVARGCVETVQAADRLVATFTRAPLRRHAAELRALAA